MSITIRNDHVADEASPILHVIRTDKKGKEESRITVRPQQSATIGAGTVTLELETAEDRAAKAEAEAVKSESEE